MNLVGQYQMVFDYTPNQAGLPGFENNTRPQKLTLATYGRTDKDDTLQLPLLSVEMSDGRQLRLPME